MSKRGRFWVVGIAAAIVGLSAGGAFTAGAVVVVGTGDPAQDVAAVQAAVDQGGIVTLSGTFDFGTHAGNHIIVPGRAGLAQDVRGESTVFIYQANVTIVGETDGGGGLLTTIRNGMPPFWIGWDGNVSRVQPPGTPNVDFGIESLPQDIDGRVNYRDTGPAPGYLGPQTRYAVASPLVSATIQHIYFDGPLHYGSKATAGQSIAFLDNVIRDVQWGGLIHMNSFAAATQIAAGFGALGMFYAPFIYPSITGNVTIEGNRVENVGTQIINTHGGECFGLISVGTNAVPIITGNEIRNVGRNPDGTGPGAWTACIGLIDNYGGAPFVGGNTVHNSGDDGIWDLTALAYSPAALITDNRIEECPAAGIESESWSGLAKQVSIEQNVILDCGSGITLSAACAGTVVGNTIASCDAYGFVANTAPAIFGQFRNNLLSLNERGVCGAAGIVPALLSCNDVWGSPGGNWIGIPDQSGVNGNISLDPLFCDAAGGNYRLHAASPCAPLNSPPGCGLIGALGVGCGIAAIEGPDTSPRVRLLVVPNPVRSTASFMLDPAVSGWTLDIYDAKGRLLDALKPSGTHLLWTPPKLATSGVYFGWLRGAGNSEVVKFLIVR